MMKDFAFFRGKLKKSHKIGSWDNDLISLISTEAYQVLVSQNFERQIISNRTYYTVTREVEYYHEERMGQINGTVRCVTSEVIGGEIEIQFINGLSSFRIDVTYIPPIPPTHINLAGGLIGRLL